MQENMQKDFDKWNEKKKNVDLSTDSDKIYFKEGQIWWCSFGLNIGSESYGKGENFRRPILVVKKLSSDLCIALPLTSKEKNGSWFLDITLQGEKRWVMLYQIKMLDKKRFYLKIGELDNKDFNRVKEKLESLLELSNRHSDESEIEGINPKSNIIIDEAENKVKQEDLNKEELSDLNKKEI